MKMQINYKEYPEFMFAMIAAYLPSREGEDLRRIAGKVVFRSHDKDGNTYKNGLLHSYNDECAISIVNPSYIYKIWYDNGKIHREGDNPALTKGEFYKEWYKNGLLHREGDNPAICGSNNHCEWYKNGLVHREGDNPAIIYCNSQEWYKNGVLHREGDLPAVIYANRRQEWYKDGNRHRDDGQPAIIEENYREWWVNGRFVRILWS